MISHMITGAFLISLTVFIHALVLDRITAALAAVWPFVKRRFYHYWKIILMIATVLAVFCAHILEIWAWAGYFLYVKALPDLEAALYFSTVTFTTVGYGDLTLSQEWRLLGSFEAANGFMLFGWSTAYIFEIVSQLYRGELGRPAEKH